MRGLETVYGVFDNIGGLEALEIVIAGKPAFVSGPATRHGTTTAEASGTATASAGN